MTTAADCTHGVPASGCWVGECTSFAMFTVADVFFDGPDGKRVFSVKRCGWGPPPRLCAHHYKKSANQLASAVLEKAWLDGWFSTWPKSWNVLYSTGRVISGRLAMNAPPGEWKQSQQPPRTCDGTPEVKLFCQNCWQLIFVPVMGMFNGIVFALDVMKTVIDSAGYRAFREKYGPGEHQKALADYLNERPACCRLGAEKLQEILEQQKGAGLIEKECLKAQ